VTHGALERLARSKQRRNRCGGRTWAVDAVGSHGPPAPKKMLTENFYDEGIDLARAVGSARGHQYPAIGAQDRTSNGCRFSIVYPRILYRPRPRCPPSVNVLIHSVSVGAIRLTPCAGHSCLARWHAAAAKRCVRDLYQLTRGGVGISEGGWARRTSCSFHMGDMDVLAHALNVDHCAAEASGLAAC
jgi:hypothetical protein